MARAGAAPILGSTLRVAAGASYFEAASLQFVAKPWAPTRLRGTIGMVKRSTSLH